MTEPCQTWITIHARVHPNPNNFTFMSLWLWALIDILILRCKYQLNFNKTTIQNTVNASPQNFNNTPWHVKIPSLLMSYCFSSCGTTWQLKPSAGVHLCINPSPTHPPPQFSRQWWNLIPLSSGLLGTFVTEAHSWIYLLVVNEVKMILY